MNMKKAILIQPLLLILALVFLGACSKYEEGKPSLASKKSRLVNHWRTQQITSNGFDITFLNLITEMVVRDNNTITVSGTPLGIATSADGAWVFSADKKQVLVTNDDGSLDTYEIVMLQKDECKFRKVDDNGATILYHFVTF
jgi:hypothetical protein